ncbi:hypothetical protein [Pediococcus acidilactici]|uniref:hypothetical protein n=1 Tax=Pediococcus acidilactici TaxID=1254 RepID=UPI0013296D9D|nr:hypothetical protein [Pediococcus acidilactici]KAF0384900.1 hypothetical protein GBO64_05180 [Pediococcus acidilactici]KAF0430000.1 hypothetical protein GBO87_05180 [Pediococcus acidilactici]KAF0438469.1 hypothetical protein GBO94_06605 [Pediococcus acidilactici]MCT3040529.1 hypothetical protein [Pediococcus acidilactici]
MIKFKDSECYPMMFDLLGLIAMSNGLTFPMVWRDKYYLKKVIKIDGKNIFILGRNLTLEAEND